MKQTIEINTVHQIHKIAGNKNPEHPLVSVIHNRDIKTTSSIENVKVVNNLYSIIFKSTDNCSINSYGRNSYDYEKGTLVFTSPGQVMEFDNENKVAEKIDPNGWSLIFHPDLFRKFNLATKINKYSFFHYDSNEALHLSENEKDTIEELLDKIVQEYSQRLDRHSQHLIVSNIELFLDYCLRFYDRQFFTRTNINSDKISQFEKLLASYYSSNTSDKKGIPNVEYCAKKLNVSTNYLSDLLKKETGKTTLEHIHFYLIEKAKINLLNSSDSISGIAYSLGFEYPQHFSNLFKSKTGFSPKEYRSLN